MNFSGVGFLRLLQLLFGRLLGLFVRFNFLQQISNGIMQSLGMSADGLLQLDKEFFRCAHNFSKFGFGSVCSPAYENVCHPLRLPK